MTAYQERVVVEKNTLDNKIKDLLNFIIADAFKEVNEDEQKRLWQQMYIMLEYSKILAARIAAF